MEMMKGRRWLLNFQRVVRNKYQGSKKSVLFSLLFVDVNSIAEFAVRRIGLHSLEVPERTELPSLEKLGIHARLPQQTQV